MGFPSFFSIDILIACAVELLVEQLPRMVTLIMEQTFMHSGRLGSAKRSKVSSGGGGFCMEKVRFIAVSILALVKSIISGSTVACHDGSSNKQMGGGKNNEVMKERMRSARGWLISSCD